MSLHFVQKLYTLDSCQRKKKDLDSIHWFIHGDPRESPTKVMVTQEDVLANRLLSADGFLVKAAAAVTRDEGGV
jgi:hypothetical protein